MAAPHRSGPRSAFRRFLQSESAGGLVLMAASAAALVIANSPLAGAYEDALHFKIGGVSLLHAVNDGLMAVFFLLVGLEIKRELIAGELASWQKRILPGVAAVGGMIVPALIFVAINAGPSGAIRGWAVPAATDIAFSLAILGLLGSRAPVSLKIFLTALAILDDLGAVAIIALFYAHDLAPLMLLLAALTFVGLLALGYFGVTRLAPYLVLGVLLWFLVLNSGVHATVAGVLLAATIPLGAGGTVKNTAPLVRMENCLHLWVTFAVLPIFGFANAGVSILGVEPAAFLNPVTLGIALGLFAGKQAGVFGAIGLAVRSGIAVLPHRATYLQAYGVSVLCGVGFTMSLFIGLLAYSGSPVLIDDTKLGVLLGSVLSALVGWMVLRLAPGRAPGEHAKGAAGP